MILLDQYPYFYSILFWISMKPFYDYSKITQWTTTIITFLIASLIAYLWMDLLLESMWWSLAIFLLAPFMQFFMTPLFTIIGVYKYLSPMLLVYNPTEKKHDLHNGTSFDYLLNMRSAKAGNAARYQLLKYYMQGLLNIIDKVEKKDLPGTVMVRGSSYFFSDRTAKRLGFKLKATGLDEKFNILLNYIDLFWMYSFAHGKWRLPNLKAIKTAEISGKDLLKQKDKIQHLLHYFNKKQNEPA